MTIKAGSECKYCGEIFSENVIDIHQEFCGNTPDEEEVKPIPEEEPMTDEEFEKANSESKEDKKHKEK